MRCAVIISLAVLAVAGARAASQIQLFRQHTRRVARFARAGPQPRAVNLSDSVGVATHERVVPATTVLHRCDRQTGCCGGDLDPREYQCGPDYDHVLTVTLLFLVKDISSGTETVRDFQLLNHTRCECRRVGLERG